MRQIREFVTRGGGIVATHETSLYDEWGVRRRDFGLADLFGASFDGGIDARMQNSYLRLETEAGSAIRFWRAGGRRAHHQRRVARPHADRRAPMRIRRSR